MFAMIALVLMAFAAVTFVVGKIVGPEPVKVPVATEVPTERTES